MSTNIPQLYDKIQHNEKVLVITVKIRWKKPKNQA